MSACVNDDSRAEQIAVSNLVAGIASQHDHFTAGHVRKVRKSMLVCRTPIVKAGYIVATAVRSTRGAAAAII